MGCTCSKGKREEAYEKKPSSKVSYSPVRKQNKAAAPKKEGKYQKLDLHDDDEDTDGREKENLKDKSLSASVGDLKHAIGKKGSGYSLLASDNEDTLDSDRDGNSDDKSESGVHIAIETNGERINTDNKTDVGANEDKANSHSDSVTANEHQNVVEAGVKSDAIVDKSSKDDGIGDTSKTVELSVNVAGDNVSESFALDSASKTLDDTSTRSVAGSFTSNTLDDASTRSIAGSLADNASSTQAGNGITLNQDAGDTLNLKVEVCKEGSDTITDDTTGEANATNVNSKTIDVTINTSNNVKDEDVAESTVEVQKDAGVESNLEITESSVTVNSKSESPSISKAEIKDVDDDETTSIDIVKVDTEATKITTGDIKISGSVTEAVDVTNNDIEINASIETDQTAETDNTSAENITDNAEETSGGDQQGDLPSTTKLSDVEKMSGDSENDHSSDPEENKTGLELALEINEHSDDNETKDSTQADSETKVLDMQKTSIAEHHDSENESVESDLQINNSTDESSSDVDVSDGCVQSVAMKPILGDSIIEDVQYTKSAEVDSKVDEDIPLDNAKELANDNENAEANDHSLGVNTSDNNHIEENGNDVTLPDESQLLKDKEESLDKEHRNGLDNHVQENELTFEKAKSVITASIQFLKSCKDPGSDESWIFMKRLAVASCIVSTIGNNNRRHLASYLVQTDFAQLFVNISRHLLTNGSKSKAHAHKEDNLKVMKGTCTNFSTGNEFDPLVCELARHGAVRLLFEELDKSFPPKTDHELLHVVHTLNILSNCVRCTESSVRQTYRNSNAVNILMKYLKSNEIKLKMESLSILAYIVDDKEGDIISRTEGCIPCLIDVLKQAVTAEDYYVRYTIAGEPSGDGVYGLIDTMNRLVVNDSCKRKLVECGGIPTILEILEIQCPDADDSQQAALETLWKVAYIEKHQQLLIQRILDSNVVSILTGMQSTSFPPPLRNASTGLLWKLGLVDIVPNANKADEGQENIWLSYDVDNQKQAAKLRGILSAAGFKVWMDENKRDGNLLSTMVNALGNSAAVLLCVSSKYKESIYCQTEATYAVELGRPIIPLRIDEFYKVDGWLSTLISTRQQFKAYSDDALEEDIEEIIEDLVECGCI